MKRTPLFCLLLALPLLTRGQTGVDRLDPFSLVRGDRLFRVYRLPTYAPGTVYGYGLLPNLNTEGQTPLMSADSLPVTTGSDNVKRLTINYATPGTVVPGTYTLVIWARYATGTSKQWVGTVTVTKRLLPF